MNPIPPSGFTRAGGDGTGVPVVCSTEVDDSDASVVVAISESVDEALTVSDSVDETVDVLVEDSEDSGS